MKSYIIILLSLVFLLSSCSSDEIKNEDLTQNKTTNLKCSKDFQVGEIDYANLKLKGIIETENMQNITSSRDGILSFLDCESGKKINSKTLIAEVAPDYDSPATKSLISQKDSLYNQIVNIKDMITQTKSNFSVQINSLQNQKKDLENQIETQNINLDNLEKQKKSGIGDLDTQKKSLEEQKINLEKQKDLSSKSEQDEIKKLETSIKNTKIQTKNLIGTILIQADEFYGITDKNKYQNDSFETYIGAKNTSLKTKIESDFLKLNNDFEKSLEKTDDDFLIYIDGLGDLLDNIKINIKDSISSSSFSQTQIDNYYNLFSTHRNNLLTSKSTLEGFIKNLTTTKNTFDSNIQTIQTQIDSIKTSIGNINENKIDSYISGIDSQINNLKVQISNLKTNINNILSQIESLASQENIQISNYKNQIISFENSIKNIDIQVSPLKIYSGQSGIIKQKQASIGNKITPQTSLCQIIPEKNSYKMKIYSPVELLIGQEISFKFQDQEINSKILRSSQSKDSLTQNYIYESDYLNLENIKEQEIFQVNIKNSSQIKTNSNSKIYIPIDFIINNLDGYYLRKKDGNGTIKEQKIDIGTMDGDMVEIKSGLIKGELICR